MTLVGSKARGDLTNASSPQPLPTWRDRYRRKTFVCIAAAFSTVAIAGCTSSVDHRGYLPKQSQLQQLQLGMPKLEVEALLGSPSTTATVNLTGDSYYYISSVVEQKAFLDPQEIDRKVLAIRFNQFDQVESLCSIRTGRWSSRQRKRQTYSDTRQRTLYHSAAILQHRTFSRRGLEHFPILSRVTAAMLTKWSTVIYAILAD